MARFIAKHQYGEGGTEPRKISLEEQIAKWLNYPGDVYNPPGLYPQQLKSETELKQKQLNLTENALKEFQPQVGTGDFWLPDPNNPKKKKLVQNVPYVLVRQDDGTFKTILPKLDEGTTTQGKTSPMPTPGVQSFTPGSSAMQNVGTALENAPFGGAATQGFNYLRRQKEQGQAGADLAARFGNAATAEDKQQILSELTDQERGLLRQHLLSQRRTSTAPATTMPATEAEARRRRQLLLYYGTGQR